MLEQVNYKRPDGSLVGTVNGMPYHILPDSEYWESALGMVEDLDSLEFEPELETPELSPEDRFKSYPPVSRAQMLAALVDFEIIEEAEAISWVLGVLPDAVNNVISNMPTNQQLTAKLQALLPTDVHTDNKLVRALAQEKGMGLEALIMLFEHAASKV